MGDIYETAEGSDAPGVYEIRLRGHLDERWDDWFGGLRITLEENGETALTGPVADQAALHGLLRKVRDLGMPLISVQHVDSGVPTVVQEDTSQIRNAKGEGQ